MKVISGGPRETALALRLLCHVVTIYYDFHLQGKRHQFVHTAFLFSVKSRWLMVTAGHCVTEIEQIRGLGGELKECLLFDSMGEGATFHEPPLPLPYDAALPMHIGARDEFDYGVIFPSGNTCRLLAANRIRPFDEEAWDAELGEVEDYFIVGFPAELNQLQGNRVNLNASMLRLSRYQERPEDFPETDTDVFFYGR